MGQIENAVAHYRHLRSQGVKPSDAVSHVMQRFGIDRDTLMRRVNGQVADSEATQATLAMARTHLRLLFENSNDRTTSDLLLRDLYEAVTGETL